MSLNLENVKAQLNERRAELQAELEGLPRLEQISADLKALREDLARPRL